MAKQRVVVEVELRIERQELAICRAYERVDLGERGVFCLVRLSQLTEQRSSSSDVFTRKPKAASQASALIRFQSAGRRDLLFDDLFG